MILTLNNMLLLKPDLFRTAPLPSGIWWSDVEDAIILRCGDLMPIYTDPDTFKLFSDSFFKEREESIRVLQKTLNLSYSIIDNYYRKDTEQHLIRGNDTKRMSSEMTNDCDDDDSHTNSETTTENTHNKRVENLDHTNTTNNNRINNTSYVYAYDSSELTPDSKNEMTNIEYPRNSSTSIEGTTDNNYVQNKFHVLHQDDIHKFSNNTNNQTTTYNTKDEHTRESRGNIGVTTTQQLIKKERDISTFNIYEWIAVEYEANFFICKA